MKYAPFLFLLVMLQAAPAGACLSLLPEAAPQAGMHSLPAFAVRPRGADSTPVLEQLRDRIGFIPEWDLKWAALRHQAQKVQEPTGPKKDLGVLKPTGRTNSDGTETWVPRDDSVLAGSIEVDVRADGLIVRQKVLRPVRVSGNAFSSLWRESGSATPRSDVALPQGTQPQGPLSVTWFQGLLKRLLELSDF